MKILPNMKKNGKQSLFREEDRLSPGNHAHERTTLVEDSLGDQMGVPPDALLDNYSFFDSNLLCLIASSDDNENTTGHSQLVAKYSLRIAEELGIQDLSFLADVEKGAVLHDIGKTEELAYDMAFSYTDSGQLIGHIVKSVAMINEKVHALRAGGTQIDPALLDALTHIILSHHGQYEFGSPKLPATPTRKSPAPKALGSITC